MLGKSLSATPILGRKKVFLKKMVGKVVAEFIDIQHTIGRDDHFYLDLSRIY